MTVECKCCGKIVISVVTVKFDFRFEFLTATSMLSNFQRRTRTEFYNLRSIGNFGLDFSVLSMVFLNSILSSCC